MAETVMGSWVLILPLVGFSLAALLCAWTGVDNLALDGQAAVAAVLYAGLAQLHGPLVGFLSATVASIGIGIGLSGVTEGLRVSPLQTGVAFLFICLGLSQMLSSLLGGNPGYLILGSQRFGEGISASVLAGLIGITLFAMVKVRVVRMSRLVSADPGLARAGGIDLKRWKLVNAAWAGLLVASAAAHLVEVAGTAKSDISRDRGFVALALVVIARGSPLSAAFLAALFGLGEKVAASALPVRPEVLDASPYILAVLVTSLGGLGLGGRSSATKL